tara:strand:- start:105801 stop:105968 length:168 start_codon:yes stop_codon:yes gene_type:complete
VHPLIIEAVVLVIDKTVNHAQHLTLHGGKRLGGFDLHQILIQGHHDARQRQHEIG